MWVKSSYSHANGNCVEVWRKSTYSMSNGHCVEVASGIKVRDSMNPDGPRLAFTPEAWREFVAQIQSRAREDSNLQRMGP